MAHFAELDTDNIVKRVVVISNADLLDDNGNEVEALGIDLCQSIFGADTTWVQTSYNGNLRARYAGTGMTYDAQRDVFLYPQPYPSWVLDDQHDWIAPTPAPACVDHVHVWDEDTLSWSACPQLGAGPKPHDYPSFVYENKQW